MESVRLRYKGGRSQATPQWNRKKHVFNKGTGYECDVPQGLSILLVQTGEYVPVDMTDKVVEVVLMNKKHICEQCGFEARSEHGLNIHKGKHKREGKK